MTEAQQMKLNFIIKKLEQARREMSELQLDWPYLNESDGRKVAEASERIKQAIDCL